MNICYLVREQNNYIAFIHVSIRTDYVERSNRLSGGLHRGVICKTGLSKDGIGNQLVNAGAEWGRQKGCKQFASDTELNNEMSIEFHKKIGFSEANRIVCFIKEL